MLLPRFELHRPQSLKEALSLMGELGDKARVLAGGTDLLVKLKQRRDEAAELVSLGELTELDFLERRGAEVIIGPMARAARLAGDRGLKKSLSALAMGAGALGSPQVRNRATIGGNLCSARPAADMCVPLLALGARLLLKGGAGERELGINDLFLGPGITAMEPDEILTSISVPSPGPGWGSAFEKLGLRQSLEIAMVNVAVLVGLNKKGNRLSKVRISLGAVAPTPIRAVKAEDFLKGRAPNKKNLAQSGELAAKESRPIDDHRAGADYRRRAVSVLVRRALKRALEQAMG